MVIPIANPDNDPHVKKGSLLVRLSGAVPVCSTLLLAAIGDIVVTAMGEKSLPKQLVVAFVLILCLAGNILAWSGLLLVRRTSSEAGGVFGTLWLAAVTNTITAVFALPYAIAYPFFVLPWVPPIVCTFAKWHHRRSSAEGA